MANGHQSTLTDFEFEVSVPPLSLSLPLLAIFHTIHIV